MTQIRPAGPLRPALLLLLAVTAAACTRDAAAPPARRPAPVALSERGLSERGASGRGASERGPDQAERPAAPADPAPIVFDTLPPPEPAAPAAVPAEPNPPATRPATRPTTRPSATRPPATRPPATRPAEPRPPRPARPSASDGPAGSCDVRPAETYCFAYTGPEWTPASAAANCAGAPGATYRPAPCPTAGRIATCTFRRASEPDRELVYSTYAPADLDLARLACPGAFEVLGD